MTLHLKSRAGIELPPFAHSGPAPHLVFHAGALYVRSSVSEGHAIYEGPATLVEIPALERGGVA
jgi:hypothetical protein